MYTAFHEYTWMTEKDHLEFEIGKAEGQLRNCRNRMDLAKREVIISTVTFFFALLIFIVWKIYRSGKDKPVHLEPSYAVVAWLFFIICTSLIAFFGYCMVKAIVFYKLSKKKSGKNEFLWEYTGCDKYVPRPEKSYVIEEEKLIRILSAYYNHRIHLHELKRKLEDGELVMTVEELQEELDGLVYFREIVPASPFIGELVDEARVWAFWFSCIFIVIETLIMIF